MSSRGSSDRRSALRLGAAVVLGIVVSTLAGGVGARVLLDSTPDNLASRLVVVAIGSLIVAGFVGWVVWRILSRRVDWERVQTEQRLWESGPLGKLWLRIRKPL